MLIELLRDHRDEIIARCRARVAKRMVPLPTPMELEHGIPLFLRDLAQTLEGELRQRPGAAPAAVQHGEDLLRSGFTIAQVVHDYGVGCQTIAELAMERNASITTEERRALDSCLDDAIAGAVTAYARRRELDVVADAARHANQHLGLISQELRSMLASAILAFDVLRTGTAGIQGSTGDVLGNSLIGLSDRVDRSLAEVRLTAGLARQETIAVAGFLEDIEVSAVVGARARKLRLTVSSIEAGVAVQSDRQILSSIISNLLQNAFTYTRPHSHVWLHTRATPDRVLFEIEDQCGGIPRDRCEHLLEQYAEQGNDHTGLGLELCVRGVKLLGGAIRVCNRNHGCMFTVDLPRMLV
ncbi:MAG TPA: HAMP domain-containing sensor histidine kinase [Kofleriaceae bacterium]|nr:HAMP domain-containing sensor histidine kinase [Kofleriaceae bacterium]